MKFKYLLLTLSSVAIFSCGSTERVITNEGKVYEIKSDKFFNNNEDVTDILTAEEKENIMTTLNERLAAERLAEEKQEALDKKQEALEAQQEKVEKAKEKAEKEQERIEKAIKAKKEAREDLFDAKEKLSDQQKKYNKLHEKGELSPNDEAKWAEKLSKLQKKVTKAEKALKKI